MTIHMTQETSCCTVAVVNYRDPELIEHRVDVLIAQRIFGLCLGYEDLTRELYEDLCSHRALATATEGKTRPLRADASVYPKAHEQLRLFPSKKQKNTAATGSGAKYGRGTRRTHGRRLLLQPQRYEGTNSPRV